MSENAYAEAEAIAAHCFSLLSISGEPKRAQILGLSGALVDRNVFLCLPTGAGKSFCFQAIPLGFEKIGISQVVVLVISPLLGLIDNQVNSLNRVIPDYAVHIQSVDSLKAVVQGKGRVLYSTPELLVESPRLLEELRSKFFQDNLRVIIFDEAHCVLLWGDSFRPAYRQLRELLPTLPYRSLMAVTATATEAMAKDFIKTTGMASPVKIIEGEIKSNIFLRVRSGASFNAELGRLLQELLDLGGKAPRSIIFFNSIKTLSEYFDRFKGLLLHHDGKGRVPGSGFRSLMISMFHRHTDPAIKEFVLTSIQEEDSYLRIIFASSAFGLGINGKGITTIIHHSPPSEVDEYIQEIGRAGRDGENCVATLFMNSNRNVSQEMKTFLTLNKCRRINLTRFMEYAHIPVDKNLCCDVCSDSK
jgi:ATP-dependent DNA helicase RecQ